MSRKATDLVGRVFGRLTVMGRAEDYIAPGGWRGVRWRCACSCGNTTVARASDLRMGITRSCGCLRHDPLALPDSGLWNTRLYEIWKGMRKRCNNPRNRRFRHYGGKGIAVFPGWKRFSAFKAFAENNGYVPGMSIDRIDPCRGYAPGNVEFVTRSENSRRGNRTKMALRISLEPGKV